MIKKLNVVPFAYKSKDDLTKRDANELRIILAEDVLTRLSQIINSSITDDDDPRFGTRFVMAKKLKNIIVEFISIINRLYKLEVNCKYRKLFTENKGKDEIEEYWRRS